MAVCCLGWVISIFFFPGHLFCIIYSALIVFSSVFVSKNEFSYFSCIIGSSFKLVSVRLKRSITVVLQGNLYVRPSLCSLCGFDIFGARTVFSVDACCLFPQCAGHYPLDRGCADAALGSQRQWRLMRTPGAHSGSRGGWQPLLKPGALWRLTTTPGAHVGSVLQPERSLGGKGCRVDTTPPIAHCHTTDLASKVAQASPAYTFRCGCSRLQTL